MPELNNFPVDKQANPNSCWACAGREINNWYQSKGGSGRNPIYASDQAFATAWENATNPPDPDHGRINIQQSAAAALGDLGYGNNTDDRAVPTAAEIAGSITKGEPLLAIVGDQPPNPNPDLDYKNGHWVVIVGTSYPAAPITIDVFDPEPGQIVTVDYDQATYQPGVYWQNTSYVDPQP